LRRQEIRRFDRKLIRESESLADWALCARVKQIGTLKLMAHFLVVEDFPPMASLLATAIRREGHTVVRVDCVNAALGHGGCFDHAILDIDLPDGDGVSLAMLLLDEQRVDSVAFFTASRDLDTLSRATTLGLVVDKAAGYDCLMAAVRQLVRSGGQVKRVAVAGSPEAFSTPTTGRSGTRRKVE
jgi:DNA-binding response OmpR family regulator